MKLSLASIAQIHNLRNVLRVLISHPVPPFLLFFTRSGPCPASTPLALLYMRLWSCGLGTRRRDLALSNVHEMARRKRKGRDRGVVTRHRFGSVSDSISLRAFKAVSVKLLSRLKYTTWTQSDSSEQAWRSTYRLFQFFSEILDGLGQPVPHRHRWFPT